MTIEIKLEKKTILVVEDDPAISATMVELLDENGYSVLTALNGFEALKLLKSSTKVSLILLDLMMPVMDGFQFRNSQLSDPSISDIPVIVMSADGHIVEKTAKASATKYIQKPVDIFHLLEIVGKYAT